MSIRPISLAPEKTSVQNVDAVTTPEFGNDPAPDEQPEQPDDGRAASIMARPGPRVGVQNYRLSLRAGDGFLTGPNSSLPVLEKEAHVHLAVHRRRGGEILAGMLELTGAAVEFALSLIHI